MKKGFTLIELLVVIAILAVLATAVVLVLNPAELLKQGRDSTRISDLSALNSALSLWVSDVLNGQGATSWTPAGTNAGKWGNTDQVFTTYSTSTPGTVLASTSMTNTIVTSTATVLGSGWIPINFSLIAAGSPLSKLPVDPNNGTAGCKATLNICEYIFHASSTVGIYKLAANMESVKFFTGGSAHVTDNDGGSDPSWYEIGSNMTSW